MKCFDCILAEQVAHWSTLDAQGGESLFPVQQVDPFLLLLLAVGAGVDAGDAGAAGDAGEDVDRVLRGHVLFDGRPLN